MQACHRFEGRPHCCEQMMYAKPCTRCYNEVFEMQLAVNANADIVS